MCIVDCKACKGIHVHSNALHLVLYFSYWQCTITVQWLYTVHVHNISIHILTIPFVCWAEANDCWCASAKVFESIQLSLSQSYKWPFKGAAFDPGVRKSVATKACLSGISELSRLLELSQIQTEFYYLSYSEHTGHSEISWNTLNFLRKILFSV